MRTILAIFTLATAFTAGASAGPLDPHQVAADAKWLMHVDFDAARDSETGGRIHEHLMKDENAQKKLKWVRNAIGVDLSKDLHGVLAYDAKFARQHGVMIIQADFDAKRAAKFIAKLPDYKSATHGKHALHRWTDRRGNDDQTRRSQTRQTVLCFAGKLVLMSHNKETVAAALDVLDGKKPNMADAKSPLHAVVPAGTILQLRAAGFTGDDVPFKSPIVRQSDSVLAVAGEFNDEVFAMMRMVAKSTEVAEQTNAVVNGFLAMAKMQTANDDKEEARKMLDAVEVKVKETTITVSWKGTPDVLLKIAAKRMAGQKHPKRKH